MMCLDYTRQRHCDRCETQESKTETGALSYHGHLLVCDQCDEILNEEENEND